MSKFFTAIARFNWNLLIVSLLVYGFMGLAGWISFHDIEKLAVIWGVPSGIAWTAPVFIDGLTYMGKLGQHHRVDPAGRKAGKFLMAGGGLMSLAANIAVGENLGMRAYGALVVIGFVTAEWYSTKLKGVIATKQAVEAQRVKYVVTQAERDARKRAGYAKMSPADKAKWTFEYRKRLAKQATKQAVQVP